MSSFFYSLYFCSLHAYPPYLPFCVTIYLRHCPSITVSKTRTCILHSPHNHTYCSPNTIALVSRSSSFFFPIHSTSLFGLPASVRAYLVIFVELDAFPLDCLSFPFPFPWSRVFDDCSITTASHHIVHTIIRSFRHRSSSTLFPGWFWMHLCGLYHVVGWK